MPVNYYKILSKGNFTYVGEICGLQSGSIKPGNQTLTMTVEVTGNVDVVITRPSVTALTAVGATAGKPRGVSYQNLLIQSATDTLLQSLLGSG